MRLILEQTNTYKVKRKKSFHINSKAHMLKIFINYSRLAKFYTTKLKKKIIEEAI